MTKDVKIRIVGNQKLYGIDEPAETVTLETSGTYFLKNDKHYVMYEEAVEGTKQTTQNLLKIHDRGVDLNKRGITSVQMQFQENRRHLTTYQTPYGGMQMGVDTHVLEFAESKDRISVRLLYDLELEEVKHAKCELTIEIESV